MPIQALGFDLDGTLYPAWKMYGASASLAFRYGKFLRAFAEARKILRKPEAGPILGNRPIEDRTAFREVQATLVADLLSLPTDDIKSMIDTIIYEKVEASFRSVKPYPDLLSCLKALSSAEFTLGILSDLPPEKKLKLLGVDGFFACSICSEDSGALKPDRRPFLALAASLGLPPSSILYVGNKEDYDIRGAHSVGMKTALIGSGRDSAADFRFRRWEEFCRWFLSGPGRSL